MGDGGDTGMSTTNEFVDYLNTLHNFNAQNQNAYAESNINNRFFSKVMVPVNIAAFLEDHFRNPNADADLVILTGHAGDGKTSIMYQVLQRLGITFDTQKNFFDVTLPTGKNCRCIKDFSEWKDDEKLQAMKDAVSRPAAGEFVFMISNTGPLINTYGNMFQEGEREKNLVQFINAIDESTGEVNLLNGWPIRAINVAAVDNTYFAEKFLIKITDENLWTPCESCAKKEYCPILRNRNLINVNFEQVSWFLKRHYTWLKEHGTRLTIRSMTEQLAFMMTGGFNCRKVDRAEPDKYLFCNLFFGYSRFIPIPNAGKIIAIDAAQRCGYDTKKMRSDEQLIVQKDFHHLFSEDVANIVEKCEQMCRTYNGIEAELRRIYFFLNIQKSSRSTDMADIFSNQFERYLELKYTDMRPDRSDNRLVTDAISMIYTGTIDENHEIPITLSKESGIMQNVQLVTGTIAPSYLKLDKVETKDAAFGSGNKEYCLRLIYNKKPLTGEITLPLLDYFEDLRKGVITTNIDPQLSHGVENIKAQLSELKNDGDDDTIEMFILRSNGIDIKGIEITQDQQIREV